MKASRLNLNELTLNSGSLATPLSWTEWLITFVIVTFSLALDTTLLLHIILLLHDNWWLAIKFVHDSGTEESTWFRLASALCVIERVSITSQSIAEFEDSDWAIPASDRSHEIMWDYVGGRDLVVISITLHLSVHWKAVDEKVHTQRREPHHSP